MSKIIVQNSNELKGEVEISGSKNSALPVIAACVIGGGKNRLLKIPNLRDVEVMCRIIVGLGASVERDGKALLIDTENISGWTAPYELVGKMRGSFLLAGALLARMKKARIAMPGGCPIGTRPVDLHLKGFCALGASISQGHGYIDLEAEELKGAKIYLDFPSVGATENIMMVASTAKGETIIENAAVEPEVVDLADFLNKCGADISGAGSDTIRIEGSSLTGAEHTIIPDRIEAGTFMTAFAMTKGAGRIKNINYSHIKPVVAKLEEMGVEFGRGEDFLDINAVRELSSRDIKTLPFPGFPTDMQAQFSALLSTVPGTGVIIETVFENRFLHVSELKRMGANIRLDGRTAVIEGVGSLSGAEVSALDLRGGAALILAGMCAGGTTIINGVEHIERGYEGIADKLAAIGAKIEKID